MKNQLIFMSAAEEILCDELMLSSLNFIQHGKISVFSHSVMVARYSERLARFLRLKCDYTALVRGALLHDFFLYDWHIPHSSPQQYGLHGFTHPVIAAKNARKHFNVSQKEYDIIIRHMWPLTITRIPNCREAWVVSAVDKYCSLLETLRIAPYTDETVKKQISLEQETAACGPSR